MFKRKKGYTEDGDSDGKDQQDNPDDSYKEDVLIRPVFVPPGVSGTQSYEFYDVTTVTGLDGDALEMAKHANNCISNAIDPLAECPIPRSEAEANIHILRGTVRLLESMDELPAQFASEIDAAALVHMRLLDCASYSTDTTPREMLFGAEFKFFDGPRTEFDDSYAGSFMEFARYLKSYVDEVTSAIDNYTGEIVDKLNDMIGGYKITQFALRALVKTVGVVAFNAIKNETLSYIFTSKDSLTDTLFVGSDQAKNLARRAELDSVFDRLSSQSELTRPVKTAIKWDTNQDDLKKGIVKLIKKEYAGPSGGLWTSALDTYDGSSSNNVIGAVHNLGGSKAIEFSQVDANWANGTGAFADLNGGYNMYNLVCKITQTVRSTGGLIVANPAIAGLVAAVVSAILFWVYNAKFSTERIQEYMRLNGDATRMLWVDELSGGLRRLRRNPNGGATLAETMKKVLEEGDVRWQRALVTKDVKIISDTVSEFNGIEQLLVDHKALTKAVPQQTTQGKPGLYNAILRCGNIGDTSGIAGGPLYAFMGKDCGWKLSLRSRNEYCSNNPPKPKPSQNLLGSGFKWKPKYDEKTGKWNWKKTDVAVSDCVEEEAGGSPESVADGAGDDDPNQDVEELVDNLLHDLNDMDPLPPAAGMDTASRMKSSRLNSVDAIVDAFLAKKMAAQQLK
jgi:hypothetical protein